MIKALPLLFLMGCASVKPYADISLGDNFDHVGDWYMNRDRPWNCSKPPEFKLELGLEHEAGAYLEIYHESDVRCGSFNDYPEVDENGWRIGYRWGGF